MFQKNKSISDFFLLIRLVDADLDSQAVAEACTAALYRRSVDAVVDVLAVAAVVDDFSVAQNAEVPADGWLRDSYPRDNLSHGHFSRREKGEDSQPSRITEGLEILAICSLVYHFSHQSTGPFEHSYNNM